MRFVLLWSSRVRTALVLTVLPISASTGSETESQRLNILALPMLIPVSLHTNFART